MYFRRGRRALNPPLEGEGRTAEGSPGWGDSLSTHEAPNMRRGCHPTRFADANRPPPPGEVETRGATPKSIQFDRSKRAIILGTSENRGRLETGSVPS